MFFPSLNEIKLQSAFFYFSNVFIKWCNDLIKTNTRMTHTVDRQTPQNQEQESAALLSPLSIPPEGKQW